MRKFLCLALMICSPSLYGGTVYQWVGKDGRVVYSDEAPPGVGAVEITLPDKQPNASSGKSGASDEQRQQKLLESSRDVSRQIELRIERRKALRQQLRAAEVELEAAKKARIEGQSPQGGERIGNVGGGTRLLPAYEQRLKSLDARVKSAEEKVKTLKKQLRKQ